MYRLNSQVCPRLFQPNAHSLVPLLYVPLFTMSPGSILGAQSSGLSLMSLMRSLSLQIMPSFSKWGLDKPSGPRWLHLPGVGWAGGG